MIYDFGKCSTEYFLKELETLGIKKMCLIFSSSLHPLSMETNAVVCLWVVAGMAQIEKRGNTLLDSITNKTVLRNTLLVSKIQKRCFQKFQWTTGSVSEGVGSWFLDHAKNRVNLDVKPPHQNVGDASKIFPGNETAAYRRKRRTQHTRTRTRG